ncbi:hypothetical protein [Aneurinibacillus aneurinilyticus]|uniref:hypothetical protein n=1 Tax=Aneurinibacillus aneurinilyticus TaxID=1391 RepID=UPI003524AA59
MINKKKVPLSLPIFLILSVFLTGCSEVPVQNNIEKVPAQNSTIKTNNTIHTSKGVYPNTKEYKDVISIIKDETKVPLQLLTNWLPLEDTSSYYGLNYKVDKNSYVIGIYQTSKKLPVNSPELNSVGSFNIGFLSGVKTNQNSTFSNVKQLLGNTALYKPIKTEKLSAALIDKDNTSFYAKDGKWEIVYVGNMGADKVLKELDQQLKEYPINLKASSGQIKLISGNKWNCTVEWKSENGKYLYTLNSNQDIPNLLTQLNSVKNK